MLNQKKFSSFLQIKTHCLPEKDPDFTVIVNGTSIPRTWLAGDIYQFDFLLDFGPNTIAITLSNKDINDTLVTNDVITHDLAISILSLITGDIDLSHEIKANSYWKNSDLSNTYGFIGHNGTLIFEFICPVFLYLRNQNLVKNDVEITT